MIRVFFSLLGQMFLGLTPKPRCPLCLEPHRNLDAHINYDHAGDDCGVAG